MPGRPSAYLPGGITGVRGAPTTTELIVCIWAKHRVHAAAAAAAAEVEAEAEEAAAAVAKPASSGAGVGGAWESVGRADRRAHLASTVAVVRRVQVAVTASPASKPF